jgi:hypothetical protein
MQQKRHHTIDLENPVDQLPYLGMPIDEFLAIAHDDGWDVRVLWEKPSTDPRDSIETLIVRYDYVRVRERDGKVVGIHQGACV